MVRYWTRQPLQEDGGTTLLELVVVLSIFTTIMSIFTGGVLQVYQAANKVEAVALADGQVQTAFRRLDREIRYARWIGDPAVTSQFAYVEFLNIDVQSGHLRCNRLVVDRVAQVLRLVTWQPNVTAPVGLSLAAHLVTDAPAPFFELQRAGSTGVDLDTDFSRLRLRLTTRVGMNSSQSAVDSDVTFTAVNTSRDAETDADGCAAGRPS
jgi:type II secretory pathway pseudopilin PulG